MVTRHKGMSRKMVLTPADLDKLERLHRRLTRLHEDMNPCAEASAPLLAASATVAAARNALSGETEWLRRSDAHKGSIEINGLSELEAIWSELVRLRATLSYKSPACHPLDAAMTTVKAALAQCSGFAQSWSASAVELSQALARGRERPPEPIKPMFRWGLETSDSTRRHDP